MVSVRTLVLIALCLPSLAYAQRVRTDARGENAMLRKINELRQEAGVGPISRHEGLDQAALAHSTDMAQHQELVHLSERTGDPATRVQAAGVETTRIAENIARHRTTRGALQSILRSEPHRRQLIDGQYTHIGIAAVLADDGIYVTQVLGRLPEAEPEPEPESPSLPPPAITDIQPTEIDEAPEEEPTGVSAELAAPPTGVSAEGDVPQPPQMPTMQMPRSGRRVAGYWLFSSNRWWYFPVPRGARPGQVLQPDPRVQGPPPGYGPQGQAQGRPNTPPGYRVVQQRNPRQRRGTRSPRRRGTIYWY